MVSQEFFRWLAELSGRDPALYAGVVVIVIAVEGVGLALVIEFILKALGIEVKEIPH